MTKSMFINAIEVNGKSLLCSGVYDTTNNVLSAINLHDSKHPKVINRIYSAAIYELQPAVNCCWVRYQDTSDKSREVKSVEARLAFQDILPSSLGCKTTAEVIEKLTSIDKKASEDRTATIKALPVLKVQVNKDIRDDKGVAVTTKLRFESSLVSLQLHDEINENEKITFDKDCDDSTHSMKIEEVKEFLATKDKSHKEIKDLLKNYSIQIKSLGAKEKVERLITEHLQKFSKIVAIINRNSNPNKQDEKELIKHFNDNSFIVIKDNLNSEVQKIFVQDRPTQILVEDYIKRWHHNLNAIVSVNKDFLKKNSHLKQQILDVVSNRIAIPENKNSFVEFVPTNAATLINVVNPDILNKHDRNLAYAVNANSLPIILKQIELRDISGQILINFIKEQNTDNNKHFNKLKDHIYDHVGRGSTKKESQIVHYHACTDEHIVLLSRSTKYGYIKTLVDHGEKVELAHKGNLAIERLNNWLTFDVNTGKCTKTIAQNNLDAITAIVTNIKDKKYYGYFMVDFVNTSAETKEIFLEKINNLINKVDNFKLVHYAECMDIAIFISKEKPNSILQKNAPLVDINHEGANEDTPSTANIQSDIVTETQKEPIPARIDTIVEEVVKDLTPQLEVTSEAKAEIKAEDKAEELLNTTELVVETTNVAAEEINTIKTDSVTASEQVLVTEAEFIQKTEVTPASQVNINVEAERELARAMEIEREVLFKAFDVAMTTLKLAEKYFENNVRSN